MIFYWFLVIYYLEICASDDTSTDLLTNRSIVIQNSVSLASNNVTIEIVPRVVQGLPARFGDVPYLVACKTKENENEYHTFCGACIVSPNKVISAAHCFYTDGWLSPVVLKYKMELVYMMAGELRNRVTPFTSTGQWRRAKYISRPENYVLPHNDISILITEQPFQFDDKVNAIPIAKHFADYVGVCLVSGFGRIASAPAAPQSPILMLGVMKLMPYEECLYLYEDATTNVICGYQQVHTVSSGDSGGPLVCKNTGEDSEGSYGVLVGVLSGGAIAKCLVYTRVSQYSNLIEKAVEKFSDSRALRLDTQIYIISFMIVVNVLNC